MINFFDEEDATDVETEDGDDGDEEATPTAEPADPM